MSTTVPSPVLFEVHQEQLETGMRGYPIGYCVTSSVDPQKGLFYVGHAVETLASKSPEEVIFLLWHGYEASPKQLQDFANDLKSRMTLRSETVEAILRLPREGHPMKLFCAALLLVGMLEGKNDYQIDGLNIIAKAPMICATVINHHAGWKTVPNPSLDKGYIENFHYMLNKPATGDEGRFLDIMKLFNILHYDHGGGNLSCFTGKAVASGLEDMWGSMAAAMLALSGPRHGRANQDCLEFIQKIHHHLQGHVNGDSVETIIREHLAKGELIYGFGHAVLRVEDPRATVLYDYALKYFKENTLIQTASLLRERGHKVLQENPKIADPYVNVDAISGSLLTAAGFEYPQYYTVLFGMSRMVGIASQIVYERCDARLGKGTPIIRPKYFYKMRLPK